jgi:hypothetical protein
MEGLNNRTAVVDQLVIMIQKSSRHSSNHQPLARHSTTRRGIEKKVDLHALLREMLRLFYNSPEKEKCYTVSQLLKILRRRIRGAFNRVITGMINRLRNNNILTQTAAYIGLERTKWETGFKELYGEACEMLFPTPATAK